MRYTNEIEVIKEVDVYQELIVLMHHIELWQYVWRPEKRQE